jgi:hypothetical protein
MKNFEEITKPLNSEEMNVVRIFCGHFRNKKGKKHTITNKKIQSALKRKFQIEISGARIRKCVNYIRLNRLIPGLVACSSGYYVAESAEDFMNWLDSMKEREEAIKAVRKAGEKDLKATFGLLAQYGIKRKTPQC